MGKYLSGSVICVQMTVYPNLRGAPRPPSLPSISADDSSSRLGSSICQSTERRCDFTSTGTLTRPPFIWTCNDSESHLVKELLCPTKDVFQLRQFQKVLLQCFLVGVDLLQFILQLFKGRLENKMNDQWKTSYKRLKDETGCLGDGQVFNQRWRVANRMNIVGSLSAVRLADNPLIWQLWFLILTKTKLKPNLHNFKNIYILQAMLSYNIKHNIFIIF